MKNTKSVRRQAKKDHKLFHDVQIIKSNKVKSVMVNPVDCMQFGPTLDLDVYKSNKASVHWVNKEDGVFSVFVIPRERTLQSVTPKNTMNVIKALERLQKIEKNCNRSKNKKGKSTSSAKYAIFGNKIHRGGHGFLHDRLSNVDPHAVSYLGRIISTSGHVVIHMLAMPALKNKKPN